MSQAVAKSAIKNGDRVRIIDADPGVADPKALVYYDFYRNLTGTVVKAYDDGTVALSVDRTTLPVEVRQRHEESERVLRDKWLSGLSEDDRNKLTQKEQRFSLKYMLLVSTKHVVPEAGSGESAKAKQAAAAKVEASAEVPTPNRPSSADLDAAEEQYLKLKRIR
jgi:hypothetical protein